MHAEFHNKKQSHARRLMQNKKSRGAQTGKRPLTHAKRTKTTHGSVPATACGWTQCGCACNAMCNVDVPEGRNAFVTVIETQLKPQKKARALSRTQQQTPVPATPPDTSGLRPQSVPSMQHHISPHIHAADRYGTQSTNPCLDDSTSVQRTPVYNCISITGPTIHATSAPTPRILHCIFVLASNKPVAVVDAPTTPCGIQHRQLHSQRLGNTVSTSLPTPAPITALLLPVQATTHPAPEHTPPAPPPPLTLAQRDVIAQRDITK